MNKGLDQAENAGKCAAKDTDRIKKAQDAGKPVTVTNEKGEKVSAVV